MFVIEELVISKNKTYKESVALLKFITLLLLLLLLLFEFINEIKGYAFAMLFPKNNMKNYMMQMH